MEISANLKSMMEYAACTVHHRHPILTTSKDKKVKIECCCVDFKIECLQLCKKLIERRGMFVIT